MREKIMMGNAFKSTATLQKAYEEFIKIKQINNLSEDTLSYYNRCCLPLMDYFGKEKPCIEINQQDIYDYLDYIKTTRQLSPVTLNTHIRGIRAYLYHCMEKGYTKRFKIQLVRCEKPIKETYTEWEIQQLLKKPDPQKCSFSEFRNWAIVCYLLGTGNRLSTVCNLKIEDIDMEASEIKLRKVKNKKAYIIPLSSTLKSVLVEYLKYRKGENDDYLFCTIYGEKMGKDTFATAIKEYNHSRKVTKTSVHLFRHTFAKNWIMNGGDIFRLQKMLGHSSLEMVKEYVNMFGCDLKENFDRFNTLDSFKGELNKKKTMTLKKK